MRKFIIASFLTLLSAAAVAAPSDRENCKKMAEFAKGIATLKLTGVTLENFHAYITRPRVQTYPIQSVSKFVYSLENADPEKVYRELNSRCVAAGYQTMYSYFEFQEKYAELELNVASLTEQNSMLMNTITSQEVTIQELKEEIESLQRRGRR